MLVSLSISNIVLIEKLNLEFGSGLNILTGETGAGKSILMDALSLALGARSDVGLIRHGCDSASVTAQFDTITPDCTQTLAEFDIDCSDGLIVRRTLTTDGKSRAWINDTPVSIKTLKQIGDTLVEIHGQFANHTLLNQATHLDTLDTFAQKNITEYKELTNKVKTNYLQYNKTKKRLQELQETLEQSASERDFLEHNVAELQNLNPKVGEEEELSEKRNAMMNAEKNSAILDEALQTLSPHGNSLDSILFSVAHILQRIKGDENPYQNQIDKLYEVADTIAQISQSLEHIGTDMSDMDSIEERLFTIRAIARKHRVSPDTLPQKQIELEQKLSLIDNSDAEMQAANKALIEHKNTFIESANTLHSMRKEAAKILREKLLQELPDLKLGSADFMIDITNTEPNTNGTDDVTFMIKTNTGAPFAPLQRAASGGELARLMLAMRVVLAGNDDKHTFVFDEVDTGISGATASAVGARLNRLSSSNQSLVVTHSAQVAGYADKHFKISKSVTDDKTITNVHEITGDDKTNEIARIISGAEITPEAIATAKTLIKN